GAPRDRRGREALGAQLGGVALELLERCAREPLAEEGREPAEVAAVGIDRSWRTPRCEQREERLELTIAGGLCRRHGGVVWRRRGCRSGSSRARRGRAAPGSPAGRRLPRAGGWRRRAGGGAGCEVGGAASRCRGGARGRRGR